MEEQLIQRNGPSMPRWRGGEAAEEAWRIGYVAAPMVAVLMSQFLVQVSSTMVVGHLGELDLAAASIAFSLANVSGFSVLVGMANGLETLCGQAYGAKQYHSLGVYTYRAIFSLLMVCLPISLLWISMGKLLQLVGQDPAISQETERYTIWLIPGLFAYAIIQPLMKFLQSQSLILPMLLSSVHSKDEVLRKSTLVDENDVHGVRGMRSRGGSLLE